MSKFDEMTIKGNKISKIPCYDILFERGFEENSWHNETGMNKNFWSDDRGYLTWVFVFMDRVYFYKEYECGGMVNELDFPFNDCETNLETIERAFESFSF